MFPYSGSVTGVPPPGAIVYGAKIRLRHVLTGNALHSHGLHYAHPHSSKQQQVTATGKTDENDFWVINPGHMLGSIALGTPVQYGAVIRLQHFLTGRNLHSHRGILSPVTHQQEVSAFGEAGKGDENDDWVVERFSGGVGVWIMGEDIRLRHKLTGMFLHSHRNTFPLGNGDTQQEVTAYGGMDENDRWKAEMEPAPLLTPFIPSAPVGIYSAVGRRIVLVSLATNGTLTIRRDFSVHSKGKGRPGSQFEVSTASDGAFLLKSVKRNRYLVIDRNHEIKGNGEGGMWCHFIVHENSNQSISLRSKQHGHENLYLAFNERGEPRLEHTPYILQSQFVVNLV